MLRYSLDQGKTDFVLLATKIDFVENYLEIEKTRFKDRLHVSYRIEESCKNAIIASFILQSIIENAIKHGFAKTTRKCSILIIDAFYQKLSATYGFSILPIAKRWNSINSLRWVGLDLLKQERIKEAITVLERRVKYRPKSSDALIDLSKALETDGQLAHAYEVQEKAILLMIENEDSDFEKAMEQLKVLGTKSGIKNQPLPKPNPTNEALAKNKLRKLFKNYNKIRSKVFSDQSTVADADSLFSFYSDSFTYNHPGYGDIYSRELLYNNTVKYLKAGGYKDSPKRHLLNMIVGMDAIIIEEQYAGESQKTVTLYKFCGDKICYIEEYW